MKPSAHLLLAAIALCALTTVLAFPMEGFSAGHRCRCLRTTSTKMNHLLFRRLEIIPAGANCRSIEIIITRKDNSTVCVSPEAKWIQDFIVRVTKRNRNLYRDLKAANTTQSS